MAWLYQSTYIGILGKIKLVMQEADYLTTSHAGLSSLTLYAYLISRGGNERFQAQAQ